MYGNSYSESDFRNPVVELISNHMENSNGSLWDPDAKPSPAQQYQRRTFKYLDFAAQTRISRFQLQSLRVDHVADQHQADWIFRSSFKCVEDMNLVEREQKIEINTVPLNWWQHLKKDHAPEWFVKKWPVKYKTETHVITGHVLYPDFDPGDRSVVYPRPVLKLVKSEP